MEISVGEAKARLSELIGAAVSGQRVVITRYGEPAVEMVRFRRTGDRLREAREVAATTGNRDGHRQMAVGPG